MMIQWSLLWEMHWRVKRLKELWTRLTVGGSDDVGEPSAINDRVMNIAVTPPSSQISSFQDETKISWA